jgi:putative flippase GtrA
MDLQKIIVGKSDSFRIQFVRYAFVGAVAAVVDIFSLFALTDWAGLHYLISAMVAFVAGLIINYLLSRVWVFQSVYSPSREFIIFAIIGIIGLALNELFLYFFVDLLGIWYMAAKVISVGLVLIWNFLARRRFAFKH